MVAGATMMVAGATMMVAGATMMVAGATMISIAKSCFQLVILSACHLSGNGIRLYEHSLHCSPLP
jgi:hypothetical protein